MEFYPSAILMEGVCLGLIAAIVADGLLYAGYQGLIQVEPALKEIVTIQTQIIVAAAVLICGLFISLICAYFSVNKFLHMKTADMYTA